MNKIPLLKAMKHDRWVKPFLKRYKWTLVLAITLGIVTFICASGLMFTAGYLISKSATMPFNILLVYVPIVLTRAFGIFRPVTNYFERLVSHNWVLKMTSAFRKKLYDSLEQDAVFFNSKYRIGDILGLLSEDVAHIQNLYLRTIFPMLVAFGLYAIIVIGMGIISPLMGLLMLVLFGLIIIAVPVWSVLVNGARQQLEKQYTNTLYADLTDNIMGITDWVFAGRSADYLQHYDQSEKNVLASQKAMKRFEHWRDFILQVMILLVVVSLIIWGAARFGGHWGGSANWIAAFVLCVFPLDEVLSSLPAAAQETNVYTDSLKRLNELPQPPAPSKVNVEIAAPYHLKITDVYYRYPKTEKPTSGTVTLNNVPTDEFGDEISNYIGIVHQSPYLFHTTILNNIRLGNEDATEDQVWDVLERVGVAAMIKRLPKGLHTMVDEAGLRFSGGERHRLSLARILLKDAPIILLDEPTVGLDPVTEEKVIETFMEQLQGKTLIWITHHLQGIEMMDQVVFIEDGKISMQGSPAELQKTNEHYRALKMADEGI